MYAARPARMRRRGWRRPIGRRRRTWRGITAGCRRQQPQAREFRQDRLAGHDIQNLVADARHSPDYALPYHQQVFWEPRAIRNSVPLSPAVLPRADSP